MRYLEFEIEVTNELNPKPYRNQLEPQALIGQFAAHPPEGFDVLGADWPAPAFTAPFGLLTTADAELKTKLEKLPGGKWLSSRLSLRTDFVGTTLSEYALMPRGIEASSLATQLRNQAGARILTIVKDLPLASPLLSDEENAFSEALMGQLQQAGFILVEGQALAYVAVDFERLDEYLSRLSKSRRQNLKRKLRSREHMRISRIPTGDHFANDERVDAYYALFEAVYAQSEIHFDKLTREFFAAVLRDGTNGGIVFEYRDMGDDALLGWNLCFEHEGRLVDKYIGLSYPQAREANLYFVSWMVNLEYAIERKLTHYVAGWTDPAVKAQLGARFTLTQHAVFIRNPWLRALGRRFSRHFENDGQWAREPAE